MADSHDRQVIHPARVWLSPEVPLTVHLITGRNYAVLIDTGVADMFALIRDLISATLADPRHVKLILNTHAHHDHIGGNARLSELTGALVGAPQEHAAWHSDLELHYREFAREHPNLIPDTPQLRAEVLETIDAPRDVDLYITEGQIADLGGGVVLQAVSLPGHMPDELGFIERRTRTLILGDALTGVDWSFFHGYSDPDIYDATLSKLRAVIRDEEIQQVRPAHYPELSAAEALAVVDRIEEGMADVDSAIRQAARQQPAFSLGHMWTAVSRQMSKNADFRGLRVVEAHLRRLVRRGEAEEGPSGEFQWLG
jgi:glyoxylase-like metal-dependent hydrolase (beta-lactamase superfamily II)